MTKEVKAFKRRLAKHNISQTRIEMMEPLIINVLWMEKKLEAARNAIKEDNIVIDYDNGGGQNGIRENPYFRGYESLWKSYVMGLSKLLEYLPEEEQEKELTKASKNGNVLELVRKKHESVPGN